MTPPAWADDGPDRGDVPERDDIDAAFAAIVASWDCGVEPSPRSPSGDTSLGAAPDDVAQPAELPPAPREPQGLVFDIAPTAWRVHVPAPEDPAEPDEFEEPDPPLPRWDPLLWCAVAGVVLGPVLLVLLVLFQPYGGRLPLWVAGGMTLGAFGILVSRLPGAHDDDDDGARV
ncbi:MAG: hypothetical protein ABI746_04360 [Dermatophilaceae bacterium]